MSFTGTASRCIIRPSGPAAQRPSGMTWARRLAGARKPAPSAGSPRRPDPRPGRNRARLSRLLPVLALLLGALSLFAAAQVQAQEISLSADRTHLREGETIVLTATLSPPLSVEQARARGFPWEIPLVLKPGTTLPSEPGDVRLPGTIVIDPRTDNSVHLYAAHDADTDNEDFTVELGEPPAGSGLSLDVLPFVNLTITDDDKPPRTAQPVPPVTNLAVSPTGNGELTVTWSNPMVSGDPWIQWREQGTSDWNSEVTNTASYRIRNLRNGRTYEVEVIYFVDGVSSRPVSATGTPNAVNSGNTVRLNVQVTPGDRRLTLTWTRTPAPSSSEGPGSYDVQYREKYTCHVEMTQGSPRYVDGVLQYVCNEWASDAEGWFSHGSGPDNRGTTRVINGLTPGTEYEVRVRHSSESQNWFYATGTTTGGTNPRLRSLQLNN